MSQPTPSPPTEPVQQAPAPADVTLLTTVVLRDYASFLTLTDGLRVVPSTVQAVFMRLHPELKSFSASALADDIRRLADAIEANARA